MVCEALDRRGVRLGPPVAVLPGLVVSDRMVATMDGLVDYSLARRAVLRDLRGGRSSRSDVCDAHPELIRAARNCGEATGTSCPVCGQGELVLVSYAFSDDFKRDNGRVWARDDVAPLLKLREARLFTVEVCVRCSWNYLRTQVSFSRSGPRRGKEASP